MNVNHPLNSPEFSDPFGKDALEYAHLKNILSKAENIDELKNISLTLLAYHYSYKETAKKLLGRVV